MPATVEKGGKWYCKRHDPEAENSRRDKRSKDMLADIRRRIDSVEADNKERDAFERDAKRYRWWRSQWSAGTDEAMDVLNDALKGADTAAEIDAAIDEAMHALIEGKAE